MRLESLRLKNFRAFRDARMDNIPRFSVLVGANGTGKSTLFSVFGFLRQAMATNVNQASRDNQIQAYLYAGRGQDGQPLASGTPAGERNPLT